MNAQKSSLVTGCPSCATVFYVTSDQLSAHHGEVRCGKCRQVFNALNHLSELPDKPVIAEEDEPFVAEEAMGSLANAPEEAAASAPLPETGISALEDNPLPLVINSLNVPIPAAASSAATSPKITWDLASKSKLNRPGNRKTHTGLFLCLAVVLVILAAAQTIYYKRTQIASQWPQFKPLLITACEFLNCTVQLPKQLEYLVIDDSDLQEDADHQGLIHLSSTLINNATFTQAYPLLEVSLTDSYDKAILRRTFTPAEYLGKDTNISSGMPSNKVIQIKLPLSASGEPVVGYRVLVTYS